MVLARDIFTKNYYRKQNMVPDWACMLFFLGCLVVVVNGYSSAWDYYRPRAEPRFVIIYAEGWSRQIHKGYNTKGLKKHFTCDNSYSNKLNKYT